jgi:tetratricopeptide (TPR) repeat protein
MARTNQTCSTRFDLFASLFQVPTLRLKIADVFAAEKSAGIQPDDTVAIIAAVAQRFSFLRPPIVVAVEDDEVVVSYGDESEAQRAEAERLAARAAKWAAQGEYKKAISIWNRVLELHPSSQTARRDLAMAMVEVGDVAGAINHLIEALRIDPKDAWSWVVLANVYIRQRNDKETGLSFLRRALEIAPADAWALNSLATVTAERGEMDEAIKLFEKAIEAKPDFANSYYGLALAQFRCQRVGAAHEVLLRMFQSVKLRDGRSRPVFQTARELFERVQFERAQRSESEAFKAIQLFKAQLEQISGYPIRFEESESQDGVGATVLMAWKHNRSFHVVRTRRGFPKELIVHLQAHELMHLQMESRAREVGKNRFFSTTTATREIAMRSFSGEINRLKRQGSSEESITRVVNSLVNGLCGFLFNCPLDMMIERRIRSEFASLEPNQFLSIGVFAKEAWQTNNAPEVRKLTPKKVIDASLALNGAYALCIDDLFQGATAFAENYRPLEAFATSRRLWEHFRSRGCNLRPGEEYDLVDEFADIVGLIGWYAWQPDTGKHIVDDPARTEGNTNPELLKEKYPAAVFFLLDALQRYDRMQVNQVRDVAFEIALLGQSGLDYASAEKKYRLRALPGELFSGLQLMCLMHAGFKRIAPSEDTGTDLDEPFLTALQLHKTN